MKALCVLAVYPVQRLSVSINLLRGKLSDLQADSEAVVWGGSVCQEGRAGGWGQSPVPHLVLICPYISTGALSQPIARALLLNFGPTCTKPKLSWFLAWFGFKRMNLCWFNLIPHQFVNSFPTGRLQLFCLC